MSASTPDPNARSLYVGNVDPSVTEALLLSTFDGDETKVVKVKLVKSKQPGATAEYGFVEFADHAAAEKALARFNGMKVAEKEIKVNWATSSPSSHHQQREYHGSNGREGGAHHHRYHNGPRDSHASSTGRIGSNGLYNVFVGDLDAQVTDAELKEAFNAYASLEDAKVMVDLETGMSRGFGFVMFTEKQDAQSAITEMQGKPLLTRNMRTNWAHPPAPPKEGREPRDGLGSSGSSIGEGMREGRSSRSMQPPAPLDYNEVVNQSPLTNVTVYVGNLSSEVTSPMLQQLFETYGEISEVRDHADPTRNGDAPYRGYGFILFKTHESAARAIVGLNGKVLCGKAIKCAWGNEKRPIQNTTGALLPGFPYAAAPHYPPNGFATNPMYFYQYPYSPTMQPTTLPTPPGMPNPQLPAGSAPPPFNPVWWSPAQAGWQNPPIIPVSFPTGMPAPSQTAPALPVSDLSAASSASPLLGAVPTQAPRANPQAIFNPLQ